MSNSLAVACKALVLGGVLLTGACAVYVNRAESAYNEGRYLEVAEQLAKREAEVRQLGERDRARYGLYRGLALLKLGQYDDAKRWLGLAQEQKVKGTMLTKRQQHQLQLGLAAIVRWAATATVEPLKGPELNRGPSAAGEALSTPGP
ncbi:MAG: hypothetical protein VB934_14330 [Polyangiaceae bacterium]